MRQWIPSKASISSAVISSSSIWGGMVGQTARLYQPVNGKILKESPTISSIENHCLRSRLHRIKLKLIVYIRLILRAESNNTRLLRPLHPLVSNSLDRWNIPVIYSNVSISDLAGCLLKLLKFYQPKNYAALSTV